MLRAIVGGAWSIVRHPAFWLPILLAFCADLYVYGNGFNGRAIGSDGWGYYLHLPAIFVHGDPHLAFLNRPDLAHDIAQYRHSDGGWQGLSVHGDGYIDKYAFGPGVVQLPFFLAALVVAHFQYAVVNGFEATFQVANALSGAFYLGLGSLLIYRAARLRYAVLPSAVALGLVILAANVLDYASADVSFSHVYGFCILSGLVYLTVWQVESGKEPSLPAFILFGFLIGLAVMVRPTNAVYALLFLVFVRGVPARRLVAGAAAAFIASGVAASPQMALWYVTTGHFIYYSYVGEGFKFTSPELVNYLFSIRKGVFFWHPLYLLMIIALLAQIARRRFESIIALLIVLAGLYIGASWGDYSFGDSFGSRQSIELLPILLLPLAGGISWLLSTHWRWLAGFLAVLLSAMNLLLFIGYMDHELPRNHADLPAMTQFWATTVWRPLTAWATQCVVTKPKDPSPVYRFGIGQDNNGWLAAGWSNPECDGVWTDGPHASLQIKPKGGTKLTLAGRAYGQAKVTVVVNGAVAFDGLAMTLLQTPLAVSGTEPVDIEMSFGNLTSPKQAGESDDTRQLGIFLRQATLQ